MTPIRPPKVAAIILAAGSSTRFGARNKLLEEIDGAPMVARVAALAVASGASPIIAVTGFEAPGVAASLRALGVTIVHNPRFGEGLSSSLRAGLGALSEDVEGALILLGDMPRVEPAVLDSLLSAFGLNRDAVCVPVLAGRRGNPLLWGRRFFPDMMALSGDRGAKALLDAHAERVVEVEVHSGSIFTDFDDEADFRP